MNAIERWTSMWAAVALLSTSLIVTAGCGEMDDGESAPPVVELAIDAETPVVVGREIRLDASGSTDPEGDPLSFLWEVVDRPEVSSAELADRRETVARFTPDVAGDYTFEVTVGDGRNEVAGRRSIEVVERENGPPVADAGPDVTLAVGTEAVLDATESSAPDGDTLGFSWAFDAMPGGSDASLAAPESAVTAFVLDAPGTYELTVTVSDGEREDEDSVAIRANRAPTAQTGEDAEIEVGTTFQLDGSASSDPDGDALDYAWSLVSAPDANDAQIGDAENERATFTPDESGLYVVELRVSDGHAAATDRLTLEVVPAGSTGSSTLYVAPDGDDASAGTEDAPLATLGEGLQRAADNDTVTRLQLAAGTYDQGDTEYAIAKDLEIVGPQQGAKPVVTGADNLLSIEGEAFVALLRLELRSDAVAVRVGDEAAVGVTQVDCRASRCVTTGKFLSERGGRVTVRQSTLTGVGSAMQGIIAIQADEVTVTETTIEGFSGTGQGIHLLQSPATIRDTVVRDSEIGIEVQVNATEHPVLIRDSQLSGNEIGLKASNSKNLTVRQTTIDTSAETGLLARGGATTLDGVVVENGGGHGVVILDLSGGALLTVRQSTVRSHPGDGIRVEGERAILDLGDQTTSGGNEIRFNKGASLHDARPDGGSGMITLRDTELSVRALAPGTYKGPNFSQWGLTIDNDNEVTVY